MGLSKMPMLDPCMLSFVDPLGPKQIIDRQSLVELPTGFIKLKFLKKPNRYDVEILDYKTDINSHEKLNIQMSAKCYLAISDLLIEGRGYDDKQIYEFEFERSDFSSIRNVESTTILQICIYVLPSAYKNKVFTGLVHVAIDELFNRPTTENNSEINAWYKIFSRSAFIAGCPIADVTPHCVSDHRPSIKTIVKSKTCPNLKIPVKESEQKPNKVAKSPKSKLFVKRASTVRMTQSFLKLVQRQKGEAPPSRIPVVGVDFGVGSLSSSSMDVGYGTSSSSSRSGPTAALSIKSTNSTKSTIPGKIIRRFSMIPTQSSSMKNRRSSSWFSSGKSPLRQFQRTEEVLASHLPWTETQDNTETTKNDAFTFPTSNFSPKSSTTNDKTSENIQKDLQEASKIAKDDTATFHVRSNSVSVAKLTRIAPSLHRKSNSVQGKEQKGTLKLLGMSTNLTFNTYPSPDDSVFDDFHDNVYDVLLSLKSLPATTEKMSISTISDSSPVSVNDTNSVIKRTPKDTTPISSQISVDKNKNFKVVATLNPENVNLTPKVISKGCNQNKNNNTGVPKPADKRLCFALSRKRSILLNTKKSSIESSTSSSDRGNTSSFEQDNVSVTDQILGTSMYKNKTMEMMTVKQMFLPSTQCSSDDEYLTCDE